MKKILWIIFAVCFVVGIAGILACGDVFPDKFILPFAFAASVGCIVGALTLLYFLKEPIQANEKTQGAAQSNGKMKDIKATG